MYSLKNNPILAPYQIKILNTFFNTDIGRHFFLTGGTALAGFYLGHRKSEDLDFFTIDRFDALELEKMITQLAESVAATIKTKVKTAAYYEVYLENSTANFVQRLDFVQEQPVLFGERQVIDQVIVDSLENIASNKILTIYGRLEPKDYLDFYYIQQQAPFDFDSLFEKTKQKDTGLHEFYFSNIIADVEKIKQFPKTLIPFQPADLIKFYLRLSERMLQKIKPPSD